MAGSHRGYFKKETQNQPHMYTNIKIVNKMTQKKLGNLQHVCNHAAYMKQTEKKIISLSFNWILRMSYYI